MTVISDITGSLFALLQGVQQIEDPKAVELEPEGEPTIFPGLGLMIHGAQPIERECGLIRWRMGVTVDGYVEFEDGTEGSPARAEFHAATVAAIMSDEQLGGLVERVDPEDFRFDNAVQASVRRLSFTQDFTIEFVTLRSNPAVQA